MRIKLEYRASTGGSSELKKKTLNRTMVFSSASRHSFYCALNTTIKMYLIVDGLIKYPLPHAKAQ